MKTNSRKSTRILVSSIAALIVAAAIPSHAATLTWDNGATTGNWNTTDANFTGSAWTTGNDALFGGAGGETITINSAGISATALTFNVTGDIIAATAANTLSITSPTTVVTVGSGLTATINAPLAGTAGVKVEGGGTLNLGGVSTLVGSGGSNGLIVGATTANNTVNLASGGTMGTISASLRSLLIGSSDVAAGLTTTGSNKVNISTPGTALAPSFNTSGNGARMTIGYASASNELNISNGAYFAQTNGNGTNTWAMGTNAGANSNSVTVTGAGSSVVFGSNQAFNVGGAGNSNTVTVSAGGLFNTRRWLIGANGGDTNNVTVTGAGSVITTSPTAVGSTNALFEIGTTASSDTNSLSVTNGGAFNFYGSGQSRNFSIGRAGNNNYAEVTGAGASLLVGWAGTSIPISVGGVVTGASTITDGGSGNHLDINNGGSATLNTGLYVIGTGSAVNLGNGTGIGTLTVGAATTPYASGVFLKNATDALNINGGRLIAGANGALVSGAGAITLNGAAFLSTAQAASTVSAPISGIGSFTKEGAGTLTLSGTNTYTGDTSILAGILSIGLPYLDDLADVYMATGGLFNLNTAAASDTIDQLFFDGVPQAAGTWGSLSSAATFQNDTFFSGTGVLTVTTGVVPEPASLGLLALGTLGLLGRRRRVA